MTKQTVYISDWFNASTDSSEIYMARSSLNETREERKAKYDARKNIIALSVKKTILTKCPDMLNLVEAELVALEFRIVHKTAMHLRFAVPCIEVLGIKEWLDQVECRLRNHFAECRKTKWANMIVTDTNTLQSNIIKALKKSEYRLKAAVHYSEKHGATASLDVLDTIDRVWSLRVA